jgi:hypothetical protein
MITKEDSKVMLNDEVLAGSRFKQIIMVRRCMDFTIYTN